MKLAETESLAAASSPQPIHLYAHAQLFVKLLQQVRIKEMVSIKQIKHLCQKKKAQRKIYLKKKS